jgi:hypothetical protein
MAWPVSALVIAFVLRRPIGRIMLETPPKKVRAGPFEVEWDRVIAETAKEVEAGRGRPPVATKIPAVREELAAEARAAPGVAVLEAYAMVERELRRIVGDLEPERTSRMGPVGLACLAFSRELISREAVRAVEGVSVQRNLAAHGSAREITPEQATEYLALVDAVLLAQCRRTLGAGPVPVQ